MPTHPSQPARRPVEPRRLHLLDLDNLIGGSWHAERVLPILEAYRRRVLIGRSDHVVIAAERRLATRVAFELPPAARLIVAIGTDGADGRLVADYPARFVADRYDGLVIGSGDGIFTQLAADLGALGLPVTVVAAPTVTSARLRLASSAFIPLPFVVEQAA